MRKTSMVALGFAAVIAAAPAFAECPAHGGTTAQGPSTPVPVAQSTAPDAAPASTPAATEQVMLTQNGAAPAAEPEAE